MIRTTLLLAVLLGSQAFGQTEIYLEDFQSGVPADYTIVDNDGLTVNSNVSEYTDAWILVSDPDNPSDSVMSSTSYFESPNRADRWLITPGITLGAFGNHLYWNGKSHDPSFPDDYYVLVSGTDTQISSFTDTLKVVTHELAGSWTTHTGNLSELGFDNQTVHIAFVNRTYDGFKLYIDSIRVEEEDPAGVNENTVDPLTVYPNPTQDKLQISNINSVDEVNIFYLDGKLVLTTTELSVNVSNLRSGSYIIEATSDKNIYRSRFIKN